MPAKTIITILIAWPIAIIVVVTLWHAFVTIGKRKDHHS